MYKASVRHLIFRLQELYQVKKVVICGIFPRFKLRKVKLDVYHEKKEKINLDFYLEFLAHLAIMAIGQVSFCHG